MKKYLTEFKLKVVKSFLAGEGGAKLLARQWSVPEEKIRTSFPIFLLRHQSFRSALAVRTWCFILVET